MKMFIKAGRSEEVAEFKELSEFGDYLQYGFSDEVEDAFDKQLDKGLYAIIVKGYEIPASKILRDCEPEGYGFEVYDWLKNEGQFAWDKLERDGYTNIGTIELELVEEEE